MADVICANCGARMEYNFEKEIWECKLCGRTNGESSEKEVRYIG